MLVHKKDERKIIACTWEEDAKSDTYVVLHE